MHRFVFKFFVCVLCLCASLMFAQATPADAKETINKDETLYLGAVRGFLWGASIETVLANEKGAFMKREDTTALGDGNDIELEITPLLTIEGEQDQAPLNEVETPTNQQSVTRLFFDDKVYGRYAIIAYEFLDNKLNRARIDIIQRSSDPQGWFDLMMDAQLDLTEKFGAPQSQNMIWRDETEKNYPPNWPAAMMAGDMDMTASWLGLAYPDVYARAPEGSYDTRVELILRTPELFRPQLSFLYEKEIGIKKAKPKGRVQDKSSISPVMPVVETNPLDLLIP